MWVTGSAERFSSDPMRPLLEQIALPDRKRKQRIARSAMPPALPARVRLNIRLL
jgi:hypothetical protein